MSLSSIPRDRLLAAAALPENRDAAQTLLRAASQAPSLSIPSSRDEGVEGASGAARKQRRGVPNKTELRFAREVLDPMVASGQLERYEFEALSFRDHASGSLVTPDFVGWDEHGKPHLFEVKGHKVHEASVLRMKLHAAARPWLRWKIYAWRDRGWKVWFDSTAACNR